MDMEYRKIINIIENKRRFGSLPGAVISGKLLAAVGNPQRDLAFIHIAGTNGKGSTAAFLYAILREAGISAGLFTSPHLIDFTERIQLDGASIPKEDAARIGQMLLDLELDVNPTMFDYALAMALLYFKERGCRLVVLETGLGGRLDSTNAIEAPLVSVITKIGYDHTAVLGETLEEIADEKAGILKAGTRAVLESQKPEVLNVLLRRCREREIPVSIVEASKIVSDGDVFSYPGEHPYRIGMLGEFQRENAMAAVLAARELLRLGYPVTEKAIGMGLKNAFWPGRMEVISQDPFLMIDGAHNEDGAKALIQSLSVLYPGEKIHFIMGVLADKDYIKMAEQILPLAAKVTAVTPKNGRALRGEELAEHIRGLGIEATGADGLEEAFRPFLDNSFAGDVPGRTVAFGSLYFIGEVRELCGKITISRFSC